MTDTTDQTPASRGTPNPDDVERRKATVAKAIVRITEITDYIGKIDAAVISVLPDLIREHPLGETVDAVADLDKAFKALDDATGELKKRISYAKEVSMPERMDAEATKTFNTDRFRVTRTVRLFASIVSAKVEEAHQWLRDNGYEALIKPVVNASALSSAGKELLESGLELPEDTFTVIMKDGISITVKK